MDVTGKGQQFLLVEHGNGLLSHRLSRLFQVQSILHGDVKHIDSLGGAPGHQGFEHALRVLAQGTGYTCPVHRHPLLVGIGVGCEGDALLLQNAHDVGLFFFLLCHGSHSFC